MKKAFKCGFCGKSYKDGAWLKKHIAKCSRREECEAEERLRRGVMARLNTELGGKLCKNCGVIGCWDVASTVRKMRKLTCQACGEPAKVAV